MGLGLTRSWIGAESSVDDHGKSHPIDTWNTRDRRSTWDLRVLPQDVVRELDRSVAGGTSSSTGGERRCGRHALNARAPAVTNYQHRHVKGGGGNGFVAMVTTVVGRHTSRCRSQPCPETDMSSAIREDPDATLCERNMSIAQSSPGVFPGTCTPFYCWK